MLCSSSKKAIDGHPVAARDTCMSNMSESIEGTKAAFLVHLIFPEIAIDQWRRVIELRIDQVGNSYLRDDCRNALS